MPRSAYYAEHDWMPRFGVGVDGGRYGWGVGIWQLGIEVVVELLIDGVIGSVHGSGCVLTREERNTCWHRGCLALSCFALASLTLYRL